MEKQIAQAVSLQKVCRKTVNTCKGTATYHLLLRLRLRCTHVLRAYFRACCAANKTLLRNTRKVSCFRSNTVTEHD